MIQVLYGQRNLLEISKNVGPSFDILWTEERCSTGQYVVQILKIEKPEQMFVIGDLNLNLEIFLLIFF